MTSSSAAVAAITVRRCIGAALLATALLAGQAAAADLVPQTKLRVSVVQWMPTQGQYQKWDALGGDVEVSDDRTILLPIIGTVSVAHKDPAAIADEIAKRIKAKIGLVAPPDTTVQVLDYPPIYVVGDVTAPGEYRYREGLTVLQALAMSGGAYRAGEALQSAELVSLVSDLRGTDEGILRAMARISRLQAEFSGAKTITFPELPADSSERARANTIFSQETVIFQARANALERQTKSLHDLQTLLATEIDTLQQKIKMSDAAIRSAEKELSGVKVLVQKGIAVAQRQSDLELQLSRYQADRLDNLTAVMRARQSITEATRSLQGLQDDRQTNIASELQQQQTTLDTLKLRRETDQKLLLDKLSAETGTASASGEEPLKFTLIRKDGGKPENVVASQSTTLLPGDVLKVDNLYLPANAERRSTPKDSRAPGANPPFSRTSPEVSSATGRGT